VRFLKVFINSLLSGFIFAIFLTLLILDLNLNINLNLILLLKLFLFNFLIYGVLITFLTILGFYIYNFFSAHEIKISFISPDYLIISFSLLSLLFAQIFWSNFKYFQYFFSQNIAKIMKTQFIIILFLGVGGLILYLFHYYYHKKLLLVIYFIILLFIFPLLFLSRSNFIHYTPLKEVSLLKPLKLTKKVNILCLEGLSLEFLVPLVSEGKLPNFNWLMENGAWGALKSLTPCEPIIYYNSFLTAKYPSKHLCFSNHVYKFYKIKTSFQVLPRYLFMQQLKRINLLEISNQSSKSKTKNLIEILKENKTPLVNLSRPEKRNYEEISLISELLPPFFKDLEENDTLKAELIKKILLQDIIKERKALKLIGELNPYFFFLSLNGLERIVLYFYKYSKPELFGNVPHEDINKYGKIIERYYLFYDQIVGKYLSSLRDNELLIVFSPHGIEPLPLWKRFLNWLFNFKNISAHYENAPEGVIFFYGMDIIRGKNIENIKLIDIVPTILYYYNFPIGKDMDGTVIKSIFKEEFRSENPVIFISSYDEISIK